MRKMLIKALVVSGLFNVIYGRNQIPSVKINTMVRYVPVIPLIEYGGRI